MTALTPVQSRFFTARAKIRRIRYSFYWLLNGLPKWFYTAFFLVVAILFINGVYKTLTGMVTTYNNNLEAFIAEDPSRFKTLPEAAAAYKEMQEEIQYREYLEKHNLGKN